MKKLFTLLATLLIASTIQAELLSVGDSAPLFSLTSSSGTTISLEEALKEHAVILVFYPLDNSPVCTKQLCEFRDSYADLGSKGATVLAINPGDSTSHDKFIEKHNLPFPLLIDEGLKVAQKYGTAGKRSAKRSVYVIGQDGKILFVEKGKPSVEDVLSVLK